MAQMVSWGYYSSLYNNISEESFDRKEMLAEKEIQSVIGPIRWANITQDTFGYEQVQDCICKVINQMEENENSGKGKGLSSVSNDGYSESYTVQTEQQLRNELHASIRMWLSGTGLAGAY